MIFYNMRHDLAQVNFITGADIEMLHSVCDYFPARIYVPVLYFVNVSLWGQSAMGEPRCNREQMQSLIMQANVHRLACLMASHRQRAHRTYGAVQGPGETPVPTLLPDG